MSIQTPFLFLPVLHFFYLSFPLYTLKLFTVLRLRANIYA